MRHQLTEVSVIREGDLIKSPPDRVIPWFSNKSWKLRHFVLKTGNVPGTSKLEYFHPKNSKLKGTIDLDQCDQVDAYLRYEAKSGKQGHQWIFDVRLPRRTYYLAAQSEVEMNAWVADLCRICNLQPSEEPGDLDIIEFPSSETNGRRQSAPMNLSGGTTRSRTTTDSSSSKDGVDPISPTTYAPGTLPRHDRLTSNNSVSSPTFSETQPNRQDLPPKPPRLTAGISITETPSKPSTPVSLRSLPPVPNGVGPEKKPNAYDHLKEMWSGPHPAHVADGPPNSPPPPLPPEFANLELSPVQKDVMGIFSADSTSDFNNSSLTGVSSNYTPWQRNVNGSMSSVESLSSMSVSNSADVLNTKPNGHVLDMVIPPRPPKHLANKTTTSGSATRSYHNANTEQKVFDTYDRPPIPRYTDVLAKNFSSSDGESHTASSGFGSLPRGPRPPASKDFNADKKVDKDKQFRSLPRPPVRNRTAVSNTNSPIFSLPTSNGNITPTVSQMNMVERKVSNGLPRTSTKNISAADRNNQANTAGMKPSWYETTTQSDYNNMSFGNTSTISYTSRGPSIDSQPEGSGSKYDEFSFPTRRVVEEEIAGGSAAPPVDRTLKPRTKPRSSESATDVNYQNKELQPRLPVKIQPKQSFKRRPSDNQLSPNTNITEAIDILNSRINIHGAISRSPRLKTPTMSAESETEHVEVGRLEYLDVNLPPSALPSPMPPATPGTPNGLGRPKCQVEYKQVDPLMTQQFNQLKKKQERSYLTDNSRKGAKLGTPGMERR